jgi:hypothetical protein
MLIKCRTAAYGDKTFTHNQAVQYVIGVAPDYYAGQVEMVSAKLDKSIELLTSLIGLLAPDQVVTLLNDNHYETFRLERTE